MVYYVFGKHHIEMPLQLSPSSTTRSPGNEGDPTESPAVTWIVGGKPERVPAGRWKRAIHKVVGDGDNCRHRPNRASPKQTRKKWKTGER